MESIDNPIKTTGAPAPADRPFRILLIDDTKDNQLLIRAYLKQTTYQLDVAENGSVGLQKFISSRYDLVFMDMQMPVMDGYTATRLIRQCEEVEGRTSTPIIAFTANAMRDETMRSLDVGCTAHVTKPLRKAEFLECIARYADREYTEAATTHEPVRKITVFADPDLEALIPRFMDNRRSDIAIMKNALDQQDYDTVKNLAHGMKGAGTGYGFDDITAIGAALEEAAKEHNAKAIHAWIKKLAEYMDRVEVIYK